MKWELRFTSVRLKSESYRFTPINSENIIKKLTAARVGASKIYHE